MLTSEDGICKNVAETTLSRTITGARTQILSQGMTRRRLPANFRADDLKLFESQLEYPIPATELLKLENVRVNYDGILFRQAKILPESFVSTLPAAKRPRLKTGLGFLAKNYLRRKMIEVDNDCVWFTNNWSDNYFHWMTDAIPRLFAASRFLAGVTVLLPGRYERTEYVRSSLSAFGQLDLRFVPEHQVFRVRSLLLPTETAVTGNYNDALIREMRTLYANHYPSRGRRVSSWTDRIYVSRGKAKKRKIVNEDGVISLLKDYGFDTVYFEDLTFEDQVLVSANAKYLVSNHGSGLTNMLFMRTGSSILELRKEGDAKNNCFFSLASALNLNYFYQTCRAHDEAEDAHTANLSVDLKKLRETVETMLRHGGGDQQVRGSNRSERIAVREDLSTEDPQS